MIKAINLRTEYMENPIGIDVLNPRLMWNVEGAVKQSAYQIICKVEGKERWDSGKVISDSMHADCMMELKSRDFVEWSVCLWDENDSMGEVSNATFEMGLLSNSDWSAKWITGDYKPRKGERYPVDCFKKTFTAGSVKKARLYVTACGLYEAKINRVKAGNFVIAPGHTDYRKRVQYQTYDVTDLLRKGENNIEVQLADGWYRGSCGAWGTVYQYGISTKLLLQLEVELADTTKITVISDKSWNWSNDGKIRFADNKDGEIVDARLKPTYTGTAKETSHKVYPTASNNVDVCEMERFKPVNVITTPKNMKVLDFGQNFAGYVEFAIKAKAGDRITLRFGENLDTDGEFSQKNIQLTTKTKTTPLQKVEYISHAGENRYCTSFAVFGFRYVLVETEANWEPEDFTGIAVYSKMEETLSFDCSHDLVNKFVKATLWSAKSNSLDVPTDCPTRERHGWSGDAQIFCNTASYLFSYATFGKKYIRDLIDIQHKDGRYTQIAPYGGVDFYMATMNGSVGWADAGVLIPYRLWKMYGDERVIKDNYESMKRYAYFMMKRAGKSDLLSKRIKLSKENREYLVNSGQSFGEWAEPSDVNPFSINDFVFPHTEESTAYTSYVMQHMAEIAEFLGKHEDSLLYTKYAEGCKKAYQELVEQKEHTLDTSRQAKLVRPLYMKLLNEKQTEFAKSRLLKALDSYNWRLGTGFLSTPFILDVLTEINPEYAYKLLENENCPGWLFMPKNGATTVWEAWEGNSTPDKGIASLNHYSKGAVCEWIFRVMCGIRVDNENHFIIAPIPGGTLNYVETEYESIYGTVKVSWQKDKETITYNIVIPANTTADIHLPDGTIQTVSAGKYNYVTR
jgi:alpha-L-rhamnosidase